MKAIFIDATNRKVENIEINFSGRCGLVEFYEKIGTGCQFVQAVPWDDDNDLVVDEEAALRGNIRKGFRYNGMEILGNGIIVGAGADDWTNTTATVDEVKANIGWLIISGNIIDAMTWGA